MFYSLKSRLEFREGKANLNVGYVPSQSQAGMEKWHLERRKKFINLRTEWNPRDPGVLLPPPQFNLGREPYKPRSSLDHMELCERQAYQRTSLMSRNGGRTGRRRET